jgi:hypothetical protein
MTIISLLATLFHPISPSGLLVKKIHTHFFYSVIQYFIFID